MFTVDILTGETDLHALQIRAFFRRIGFGDTPTGSVERQDCFKFWVYLLISKLKFLEQEQQTLLFEEMLPYLQDIFSRLYQRKTPMVVIADSQYATWYGKTGWLDLTDGKTVDQPEYRPLETIAYDFCTIWKRNKQACEKRNKES